MNYYHPDEGRRKPTRPGQRLLTIVVILVIAALIIYSAWTGYLSNL